MVDCCPGHEIDICSLELDENLNWVTKTHIEKLLDENFCWVTKKHIMKLEKITLIWTVTLAEIWLIFYSRSMP